MELENVRDHFVYALILHMQRVKPRKVKRLPKVTWPAEQHSVLVLLSPGLGSSL